MRPVLRAHGPAAFPFTDWPRRMPHSKAALVRRKADQNNLTKRKAAQAKAAPVVPTGPHEGCCRPMPDARFIDETLVSIHMHHTGKHCGGYMDPYPLEQWWKEVSDSAKERAKADGRGAVRESR